ncbi:secondary thiamine-phosphate synthase enzyme YjbQ [Methanolinea mesophila]|uniref:secondary thiamine-phosphate synthase enzyme YjbQ n=1 Tax=Methanolinea mesophila TaxID=547055 RepID=UPI001AE662F0|nr:secondary thiamine-phosphate synthase enzyme YjbQ [Methanolinea mesophila]
MFRRAVQVTTQGEGEIHDITPHVREVLDESGVKDGMANVFITGSTAAVTTIEYETGVLRDLSRALSVLAPDNAKYSHDAAWGDGNGRSHVKAALVGPSLSVPVADGSLALGTWQQIVLLELDVRSSRTRTILVTVWGEKPGKQTGS